MLNGTFTGTLRKYDSFRVDDLIYISAIIKHKNETSTQSFLNSFATKMNAENIKTLFDFPVRWKKLVIDTSDYIQSTYKIVFGETEFKARLSSITITRKLVEGNDIFEYSFEFIKKASADLEDRVIVEAYLDYKEEDNKGKMVYKEFDVKLELLEDITTPEQPADEVDEVF